MTTTCPHCGKTITRLATKFPPSDAYERADELIGSFVTNRLVLPGHGERPQQYRADSVELNALFRQWLAVESPDTTITPQMFGQVLHRRGIRVQRSNGRRYYVGVAIPRQQLPPVARWEDVYGRR